MKRGNHYWFVHNVKGGKKYLVYCEYRIVARDEECVADVVRTEGGWSRYNSCSRNVSCCGGLMRRCQKGGGIAVDYG